MKSSTLILHIHDSTSTEAVNWLFTPANKPLINERKPQQTSWSELPTLNKKDELIVIVPAIDVTIKTLQLPKVNHKKTLQAIPYMLEEYLAEDINQLHFSYIQRKNSSSATVAIVKKTLMVKWLNQLQKNQLKAMAFIPESLLLPSHHDGWTIFLDDQFAIIRFSDNQGTAIEHSLLPYLLEQKVIALKTHHDKAINEHKAQSNHIDQPVFHIYLHSAQQHKDLLAKIKGKTQLHIQDKPLLLTFADTIQNNKYPLNLLQNEFQAKGKVSKRAWLTTLCLLVGMISLTFIAQITQHLTLKNQLKTTNAQVTLLYQQIFPGATAVTAPRIRIQEKINTLRQGQQNSPFIELLSITGESLTQIPGIQLRSIAFNNGELTMELETHSAANLDRFSHALRQYSIQIKENNITAKNNAVEGRLSIVVDDN